MEEFPVPNTTLVVDHFANLYCNSSRSFITSELVRIGNDVIRTRAVITNTYLEHDRYDLIKKMDKPVYQITGSRGEKYLSTNLSEFCRDEGLDYKQMHKAYETGYTTKQGWKVEAF